MIFLDFLYVLTLIIFIPLNPRFIFSKSYRKILKGRFSPDISSLAKGSIWIHAVSVGEVKSLREFISLLRKRTDRKIILSVTTPSGFKMAKNIFKDIDIINGPFDLSFIVKKFIRKISPSIIILNELEIWPNWISIANGSGIPMVLINGRISEQAFKRYKRFSFFLKRFFRKIDLYLLQEESYIKKFVELGAVESSVKVSGNIKADEALKISDRTRNTKETFKMLRINKPGKKILILASTHSSDEDIFIPVLNDLLEKYFIIIAPRHMNRVSAIATSLKNNKVPFLIWSKNEPGKNNVIIFDKMGLLAELINISDIVFMGGSYNSSIGGHNLYEPAVFGKKMIGGPCYNNFPSIGKELVNKGIYTIADSGEDLLNILVEMGKQEFTSVYEQARRSVLKRSGAIEFSIKEVLKLLN